MGFDVDAITLGHALEEHPQMQLTGSVDDRFVQGRVVLDADAGVFGQEFMEGVGEALLVATSLGLDGDTEHGRWQGDGLQVVLVLVVGVMQNRVHVQLIDF